MARRQPDGAKERFWRQAIQQWRRSGLSIRAFCVERDLSEPSFYAWRRLLHERDQHFKKEAGRADVARDMPPTFVPVQVVPAAPAAVAVIELVLRTGGVVRVPPGFDAATLRQLLAVFEEPSC
jgi:hypothetical protein